MFVLRGGESKDRVQLAPREVSARMARRIILGAWIFRVVQLATQNVVRVGKRDECSLVVHGVSIFCNEGHVHECSISWLSFT